MSNRGSRMKFFNRIIKLSLVSTFVLVTNANASTTTWGWDLTPGSGACTSGCSSISASDTVNGKTITAGISGYADTIGKGDADLESGKLHYYSGNGWGLVNKDEGASSFPGHAFDNEQDTQYRDHDMALVSFDTSVELTAINFGWIYDDADFTVLAFSGTDIATTPRSTWSDVATSGDWVTVGNYDANNTGYYSINQDKISSQYWLIGAYNSIFGATNNDLGHLDSNTDAFKIKGLKGVTSVTTPPEEVPAPAAFGLLLVGALGMYVRRNKQTT